MSFCHCVRMNLMNHGPRPKPQNNGFHNESCHGDMVLPHLTAEQLVQTQPITMSSQLFVPVKEERHIPVELHEHAADVFNRDYKYQPKTWNGDCYDDTEKMVMNIHEDNQNFIYWNDPFTNGNFTQLAPPINPYNTTSVRPILQDMPSPYVSVKQNHQMEDSHPTTKTFFMPNEETSKDSQVCPICGRTFVYQLNFAKHMAAAGCCEPPCKKTRKDAEADIKETFKCNTLPRASRAKKITRSNSTRSRKKQTSLNSHPPVYLPNSEMWFPEAPLITASTYRDSKLLAAQHPARALTTSDATSQTVFYIGQESTYCTFCKLQLYSENLYQRHRLAHALVIQLTRCLVLSLPKISSADNETAAGRGSVALGGWLSDQIRVNSNDENWVKLSVHEVEQVLGHSNMDVDIPQRHGIQDNAGYQNIVDLLATQDLNLTPANEFADATRILDFIPQEMGTSTSSTYDPFAVQSMCRTSDLKVPSFPTSEVISPIYQTCGIAMSDVAGCTYSQNFYDFNQSDQSFKSLITDIDVVERQMASLFKTFETPSPSGDRNPFQPELDFQHICNDHQQDMFAMPSTIPSRPAEYPYTFKVNVELANHASNKMLPVLGDSDRKLHRSVRSTTPEEEENLTY